MIVNSAAFYRLIVYVCRLEELVVLVSFLYMRMGVNSIDKSWILKKFSWCCLRYSYTGFWGIWTNLSCRLVVHFLVTIKVA